MSWGFMLLQTGRAPRPVTNVRDDTILKSSFWRSSFEARRCLVELSPILGDGLMDQAAAVSG
jgi:putative SOS response-associated peptidase YedK